MDINKMRKQAQILRNKKLVQSAPKIDVKINNGVIKVENASPIRTAAVTNQPPSRAEILRQQSAKVLKQRQELAEYLKVKQAQQQNTEAQKPKNDSKGCSNCRRKIGG